MNYFCCDDTRRTAVLNSALLNGIDYLEVVDNSNDSFEDRQTTLLVYFLKDLVPGSLDTDNVLIEGGERIQNIKVIGVSVGEPGSPFSPPGSPVSSPPGSNSKLLIVKVNQAGDFSSYTLRLVQDDNHSDPPDGFDPVLSSIVFSFKVLCPSDFDCQPQHVCNPEKKKAPEINYLAKDYSSFRQLMLDRMSLLYPAWTERNAADPGIMMVELLAYVGDYLSYRQDSIATEAYLGTARRRVSVRRHARLVDYRMHDGSNARTWAHVDIADGNFGVLLQKETGQTKTKFLTRSYKLPGVMRSDLRAFRNALNEGILVFELLHDITLDARHNKMNFYTWAEKNCCLPKGATSATLDTHLPALQAAQVLIFQEVLGPRTGKASDADPAHRHAVMLTSVTLLFDPLGSPDGSPPDNTPRPVTEITWHDDDALPFPFCITTTDQENEDVVVSNVLGNNVLVDHGNSLSPETLDPVPDPSTGDAQNLNIVQSSCDPCKKTVALPVPLRYNPVLRQTPLTQAAAYDTQNPPVSATAAMQWSTDQVLPAIKLTENTTNDEWTPVRDLIASSYNDKHFVAEVESNYMASLRFGDDVLGQRPTKENQLNAGYRIGNGTAGNIGAMVLQHLVCDGAPITADIITGVSNPLPASGGIDPESIELVRNQAPISFRTQERAVTMADYEEDSKRVSPDIQNSAATLRWTGSWRTVFLTVDRLGGKLVDDAYGKKLRSGLEKYRMAGQDLEFENPQYVSLEIDLTVCAKPNYLNADIKAELMNVLSNRILPNGNLGLFHPDNFSFGQPVYLSRIYAAAQQVEGVRTVTIQTFQRQGDPMSDALKAGVLEIGRVEIARLDNDPNFPEHGILNIEVGGGK